MNKAAIVSALFFVAVATASLIAAQEAPDFPAPQKEHDWLRQFVGTWETTSETVPSEEMPAMTCTGTLNAHMLGGFWVVSEWQMEMGETTMNAIQTIGYDPEKQKYVGTWVDSMMNHLWHYEGTVDESGQKLTLEAEGPNFMQGSKMAKFRDAYEFKSEDHILLTSSIQDGSGKWITFMTGEARKKK